MVSAKKSLGLDPRVAPAFRKETRPTSNLKRPTEHASEDCGAVRLEAASVAENDALRLPRKESFDGCAGFPSLQQQRQAHAEEYLAAGVVHPRELRGQPPRLGDLVQLEVDDGVGDDSVFDALWKKTNSPKMPPGMAI